MVHLQLLRRYTACANVGETFSGSAEERAWAIASQSDVVVGAVETERAQLKL